MTDIRTGGCLCGAIRYEIRGEPRAVMQCHCTDCQRVTGGNAALIALHERDSVSVTGTPAGYSVIGASGGAVRRCFCRECGTGLHSELEKYPRLLALKVGLFDTDPGYAPQVAIWTASAPPWHHVPEGIPTFPGARPA